MPGPSPIDELLTVVSDSFRGERTTVRAMLIRARERAEQRVREELGSRLDAAVPGAKEQDPVLPPRAAAPPTPLPPMTPDGPVEITLPSERRLRGALAPSVARRRDLAAFGRIGAVNDRRAFAAMQRQGDALESLRRSHEELAQKVATLQAQADLGLLALLKGLGGVEQQVQAVNAQGRALVAETKSARKLVARQWQEVRSLAVRAQIQNVTAVVNSTQAAAYGQRGSVLAANNLLLAGNQLFWTFIEPLLRSFGLVHGTAPSVAAWLAPLGSLMTGHVALGNRQHVRFVSGVATFEVGSRVALDPLRDRIADDLWPEFQSRTDVLVTTVPLDVATGIFAAVRRGVLVITLRDAHAGPAIGRVAWMVDTGVDVG